MIKQALSLLCAPLMGLAGEATSDKPAAILNADVATTFIQSVITHPDSERDVDGRRTVYTLNLAPHSTGNPSPFTRKGKYVDFQNNGASQGDTIMSKRTVVLDNGQRAGTEPVIGRLDYSDPEAPRLVTNHPYSEIEFASFARAAATSKKE